jgi:DNA-binding NtrC family response regulator
MSRTHAVLRLGPPITIEDLGSANGTRVRDVRLAAGSPVEVVPGEPVQLGAATLIIQRQVAPIRMRRVWAHDYFEVRVEEECARTARGGAPFGVLRLTCAPGPQLQETMAELARLSDVVGEYGPMDFEILLVDANVAQVGLAVTRLSEQLALRGVEARIGAACYPSDGRTADQLLSTAGARSRGQGPTEAAEATAVVPAERAMQDLYAVVQRIAQGTISVLILGETGVGKEVLAERVHKASPRASKPYLRLNCAALTETLLESELFGHERGSFTGAVGMKPGLLETADGGTVFLDEIGELPLSTQVKLLRVIEERKVTRVGGLKALPLDVRFIAATNRDLELDIERGVFRQDLYFRLNGATLVIPPLRERLGELRALTQVFLEYGAKQAGLTRVPELTRAAEQVLLSYSWPGNIRELRNAIERAVLLSGDGPVLPQHLPIEKMRVNVTRPASSGGGRRRPSSPMPLMSSHPHTTMPIPSIPSSSGARSGRPVGLVLPQPPPMAAPPAGTSQVLRRGPRISAAEERAQIEAALVACAGNQTRAAKMLGIARRTLINRLEEFGLSRPRSPRRKP